MKFCVECAFGHKEAVEVGPKQYATAIICRHEECRDPVSGEPIPANIARRDPVFCGFKAVHWLKKDEANKPVVQLIEKA